MTNEIVRKTKDLEESYALQYGTPALANGVGWDGSSSRLCVCAERMVVVFEASNETRRRDDAGVGLLRWRQDVPIIGQSQGVFDDYRTKFAEDMYEEEDARMRVKMARQREEGGGRKVAQSKGTSADVARGRDGANVRAVVKACAAPQDGGEVKTRGVRGAVAVMQTLDDAYWTGSSDTPRVLGAAWSPGMCGGDGGLGSMVGVCFDDGSLMLFSKASMMTAFWVPEMNLSRVHAEIGEYVSANREELLTDVVFPGTFIGVAWSDTLTTMVDGEARTYSIIGGITDNGTLELYRVTHIDLSGHFGNFGALHALPIEQRVVHVGTVRFEGEYVTQVTFGVSAEHDNCELLVVCGCEGGGVHACIISASEMAVLEAVPVGIDAGRVDLVARKKVTKHSLIPKDDLVVTSLAVSITTPNRAPADQAEIFNGPNVVVAVGKTMGALQIFKGGNAVSLETSIKTGGRADLPTNFIADKHSISGLAFLHVTDGQFLVAGTRLGNLATLRLGTDPIEIADGNPVHHTMGGNKLQYAGFGCYGLAASPGGMFVAVARQAQEPDREFRVQQQIHQMVTQGYLHIQSIIGSGSTCGDADDGAATGGDAEMADLADPKEPNAGNLHQTNIMNSSAKAISNALISLLHTWSNDTSAAGALWDAARLAALLETMTSHKQMVEVLSVIQREAGVSLGVLPGTWVLEDEACGQRTCRYAAAMLHVLRALQGDYHDHILRVADWEMVSMKGHIASLLEKCPMTDAENLTALLAIDLIVAAHESHPWLFPEAFVESAKSHYGEYGGTEPPETGRPISFDLDLKYVAPITAKVDGGGASMDQVLRATVINASDAREDAFDVMRCPATLQGNLDGGGWICSSCKRSYCTLPRPTHFGFDEDTVACTLCASAKICTDVCYFS